MLHAELAAQVLAPRIEVRVQVERSLRRRHIESGVSARRAAARLTAACSARLRDTRSATSAGSSSATAAACWTGPAGADQISLAMPSSRSRKTTPAAPSGIRATPIRHPPTARFLLSAVVTTVRRGATSLG